MIDLFHSVVTCAALGVLALIALFVLSVLIGWAASALRRALRPWELFAFAALSSACALYGRKGTITFPRTDADIAYLSDRGSYVTNDFVHVDFARVVAPDSAHVFFDYRQVDQTNDTDWTTLVNSTFAEFSVPTNVPFANATNYDWMVYTTWTPGPAVLTNGVWHAMWGIDRNGNGYLIPVRTAVRVDGETIATPKSREDARNEQ